MKPLYIVTAVFDHECLDYNRLLHVWERSAYRTNPKAEIVVLKPPTPKYVRNNRLNWISNHAKLEAYVDFGIKGNTVFVDVDTVLLRDLSSLFEPYFDIAIGKRRKGANQPINGGVVLFRDSPIAKAFLNKWFEYDSIMMSDKRLHKPWRKQVGGMNQASFAYTAHVMKQGLRGGKLLKIPTRILNACREDWPDLSEAYILHVMAELRDAALSNAPIEDISEPLREAVNTWRRYESSNFLV